MLSEEDDFGAIFGIKETESDSKPSSYHPSDSDSAKPVRRQRRKAKKRPSPVRDFNKNGLPVLDPGTQVERLFEEAAHDASRFKVQHQRMTKSSPDAKSPGTAAAGSAPRRRQHARLNKHGLPIIDQEASLQHIFNAQAKHLPHAGTLTEKGRAASSSSRLNKEDFVDMLEKSLAGKNQRMLLKEKKDNLHPAKPLTVKQRIKRYPAPQGQLDLHGFTASQAEQKVEAYLRNAYHRKVFTLRLIVGKGLHSENGPVLPDIVEDKLIELKHRKMVLDYQWEKKKKSKSGSVVVYLAVYDG